MNSRALWFSGSANPNWKRLREAGDSRLTILHIAGLLVVCLCLTWPLLIYGAPDESHDAFHHARWAREFATQFWHGEWLPRWFPNVNGGFGGPSGFFYPPLGNYICALCWPLVATHQNAGWLVVGYEMFLSLALSGIAAYLWLRSIASAAAAFCGAALYVVAPYHLAVDAYMRGAAAELWMFVWLPLVLLSAQKLITQSRWAIPGIAASFALAILSHPIAAFCFAFVPLALVLVFSGVGERLRNTGLLIAGLLLGAGLSSFYLIPAVLDRQKANTDFYEFQITEPQWLVQDGQQLRDMIHYVQGMRPAEMSPSSWNVAFRTRILATTLLAMMPIGALFVVNRRPRSEQLTRRMAVFWASLALLCLFLMTNLSSPVWRITPPLKYLQYPFRLNILLVISSAALLALAYPQLRKRRAWVLTGCVLLLLLSALDIASVRYTFSTWRRSDRSKVEFYSQYIRRQMDPPEMWPKPGNEKAMSSYTSFDFAAFDWFVATHPPKAVRLEPVARRTSGAVRVESWQPRRIVLNIDALRNSSVTVNHFYFSGWQAEVAGAKTLLPVRPSQDGLIEFEAPKGSYKVMLELPRDGAERSGIAVSGVSLLSVVALGLGRALLGRKSKVPQVSSGTAF